MTGVDASGVTRNREARAGAARREAGGRVAVGFALLAIGIALLALAGWAAGSLTFASWAPGLIPMKVNLALAVAALGVATILAVRPASRARGRASRVLGLLAMVLASATLYEHVARADLGIDRLLMSAAALLPDANGGRMAAQSAAALAIAGAAIVAFRVEVRGRHLAQLLALLSGGLGYAAILGYVFGVSALTRVGSETPVSLPAAVSFVCLAIAVIMGDPEHALAREIVDPGPAGQVARSVFPAALLVVPVGAWLRLVAERAGLYTDQFGLVLTVSLEALILLLVGVWASGRVLQLERARAEAQATRDRFFDLSADGASILSRDGRFLFAGSSWAHLAGYRPEELEGRRLAEFLDPADARRATDLLSAAEGGDATAVQARFRTRDGSLRWFEWTAGADEGGARVYAIARDVTERLRAAETDARLAALVSSSADAILAVDAAGRVAEWAGAAEAMLGYRAEEALGMPLELLLPPGGAAATRERVERARAGEAQSFEATFVGDAGTAVHASVSCSPVREGDGGGRAVSMIVRDVTERVLASAERERREALLREQARLLELAHDAIIVRDLDGKVRFWNAGAAETYGWTADQAVGATTHQLLRTSFPDSLEAVNRALLESGRWEGELRHTTRDGRRLAIASRQALERDEAGRVVGVLEINRDVTESVAAHERLEEYAQALSRSNADLEQFAYVASHDLQEPLRMVTGFMGLLQKRYAGRLGADADEYIAFAVDGARRMQGLINDLLTFSRVDTRGRPFEPVRLDGVLDDALANLRATIEASSATIHREPLPEAVADRGQMLQLLQNLLANALKFHRPGVPPEVWLGAERGRGEWCVSVRDHGIGIAPDHYAQIFEIFRRLHGREEYPGSGIGLAICKKIVERHGGRIWVESTAGEGATFRFALPDRASRPEGAEAGRPDRAPGELKEDTHAE